MKYAKGNLVTISVWNIGPKHNLGPEVPYEITKYIGLIIDENIVNDEYSGWQPMYDVWNSSSQKIEQWRRSDLSLINE